MKHLNKYDSINNALEASGVYSPNVSYVNGSLNDGSIVFTNVGSDVEIEFVESGGVIDGVIKTNPLCFTANEAGSTVSLGYGAGTPATSYEYSTDKITWNAYTIGDTITLTNEGDKVYFRGDNSDVEFSGNSHMKFTMTGSIAASGNIMSLLDTTMESTTVQAYAFYNLFNGCASLTTAPVLPATTLAERCYASMFGSCTSLTTVPSLPAITLAPYCCSDMFSFCVLLTTVPKTLPATTLASYCYGGMFGYCTSLTSAPELPATTLVDGCYGSMFGGCGALNYIKCLATDISATNCLNGWVSDVAESGTFVKNASMTSWTTGTSGIPSGWTVEDA